MEKLKKKYFYIFCFLLTLSFIIGYIFQENSAGGGEGDYGHILNNYELIFNNNFKSIDWSKYRDGRFPLDYFIFKFYLPNDQNIWRLNIFLISLLTPFVLFYVLYLKNKFSSEGKLKFNYLLFLSLFLFVSPYFRTSAYWMLRENIGYLFWILSVLFLFNVKLGKYINLNLFFCTLFSFCSFYSSQNLFIVPLTNFFLLININNLRSKKNIKLILLNLIFFSPLILFYDFFAKALQYIEIEEINRITFNVYKIIDLYCILLIYFFPIILIYFSIYELTKIFKKNFLLIIILLIIFTFSFWGYSNADLLSGGAIRKVLNILISNELIFKILYLSISALSCFIIFYLSLKKEKILFFFILSYSIFYCFTGYVFQEYLDPVTLLFVILYSKKFIQLAQDKIIYLFSYFLMFYLSSYCYYYYII